jgi:DNA recombination protein RmuC
LTGHVPFAIVCLGRGAVTEIVYLVIGALIAVAAAVLVVAFTRRSSDPGNVLSRMDQLVGRLDALDRQLGGSFTQSVTDTAQALGNIQQRLQTIDQAQAQLNELSTRVLSFQEVLADKQSRGAFGEDRMRGILEDQLKGRYDWQKPLSNRHKPDCLIRFSKSDPPLVADSKFPFEAYQRLKNAPTDDERRKVGSEFKRDILTHVRDISEKYLIVGETQPVAFMFIPSESVYAHLHDDFPEVIQEARRKQVIIVSPHIFMLAVNVMQTLLRDAAMREEAERIRRSVLEMMQDVNRLKERITNLRRHFGAVSGDFDQIETSLGKITKRVEEIENVELLMNQPASPQQLPDVTQPSAT